MQTKKFPSLADFQFVSTTKKFPFPADFQFVSTCSQLKILFHLYILSLYQSAYISTTKKFPALADFEFMSTLTYLIVEQDVLSEQALNSKFHPTGFLFTAYVVPNKRAGTK